MGNFKISGENPLLQNLELVRAIIETSPDMINIIDGQGITLLANQRAVDLLGYSSVNEIIGKNVTAFIPSTELQRLQKNMLDAFKEGGFHHSEYPVLRKDGTILHLEANTTILEGVAGLPRCFLVITRDITQHRRLEKTYQKILDVSMQGIAVVQDQRIVYSNQAAADILGYQSEDIQGTETAVWTRLIHPEDKDRVNSFKKTREVNSLAYEKYDLRMVESGGEVRWLDVLRTETEFSGRPAIQFSVLDQTMRRQAEEAYRETMERYQALAEAAQDMIYIIDRENKLLYANEHTARLQGKKPEELIGRKREEVVPLTFAKKLSAARRRAMLTGESTQVEDRVPTVNGKRWYSLIFVPLRDASGEVTSVMGISRDIHEQKKLELALKKSNSRLEKRVSERTRELLASHEQLHHLTQKIVTDQEELFRHVSRELHDEAGQALIALKFNLTTVLEELPAEASNLKARISDSIEMIDQARETVRTLAHNLRPPVMDVAGIHLSLVEFCNEYSELSRIPIVYNGIELPDLPEVIRISLYRFVQEAIINIIKHAQADAVQVTLSCLPGQIQLSVSDNGKGFDPALHTNGIGLLGIKERIQLINGQLEVISKTGEGTRLTATVPWDGKTGR